MNEFNISETPTEYEYVGFWARVGASMIDTVLFSVVLFFIPLPGINQQSQNFSTQSMDTFSSSWAGSLSIDSLWGYLPLMIITILFWRFRSATPGKMLFKAKVVDAKTGQPLTTVQSIIRYLGYFVSIFVFMLGFIWVGFDRRKQGFHDKLAGSVVIRPKTATFEPTQFK
ncbi:RDD family protein [Vibrio rumoiensis]|uniref:RDD domain-containing protein n=1 Tax=Vibrio rumoiensis 1S-45 TaxID=1188252 RepID=A0A1E5E1T3_9VIBR|nr:RDD family protein [Vibrio rumoiensis]OEF24278.1 hypothetical protein A1QC_10325 [Vibrio rumoiensis 1S-45]